jgi:hypothetical protein
MVVPDRFVAEQNIVHYRSRLQMGAEPVTRGVLLELWLSEEKSLGRNREQLKQIDSHIEKLRRPRVASGLANRRLQPLGHLSNAVKHLFFGVCSVKADCNTGKARRGRVVTSRDE